MTITPNKWELDVQGYLNVCNITAATPRKQIRDFSAGVNELGLWNSMVCWPLRSSQNAGTGTTAFSLGGLGTYNGTLVNGPTWGVNGLTTVAQGLTINADALAPVLRSLNSHSTILVAETATLGTINFGVLKGGGDNQTGDNYTAITRQYNFIEQVQRYLTGGTQNRKFGARSFNLAGFNFFASSRSDMADPVSSTGSIVLNGTENNTLSGTGVLPTSNPYAENFVVCAGAAGNTFSFAALIMPTSPASMQAIREIYRTTLGQGITLP